LSVFFCGLPLLSRDFLEHPRDFQVALFARLCGSGVAQRAAKLNGVE